MRKLYVLFFIVYSLSVFSQELKCTVTYNATQVGITNQQIFQTLQKSLQEFMNNTKWSTINYKNSERIECSFFFNFTSYNINQFSGTLQIQSSRPVYGSTFTTPILNLNDKDINFTYTEFQNLVFDPNNFDNNLVALMAFYANIIIGADRDTFAPNGGTKAFEQALNIVNLSQSSQIKGWVQTNDLQSRFYLVNDMLSNTFDAYREAMFQYHFEGFDKMTEDIKIAKQGINNAIQTLMSVGKVRPNAYLTRVFFDTKSDEIVSIFSDGPKIDLKNLNENLNSLSLLNASKWLQILN